MKLSSSLVTLIALGLLAFGCGGKKNSEEAAPPPAATPDGNAPDPNGGTGVDGSKPLPANGVKFSPVSFTEFSYYVGKHPLNDPKDFHLVVDLAQVPGGGGRYAGTINIKYTDTGKSYNGVFTSKTGKNQSYPKRSLDDGKFESEYNYWFKLNNKLVFAGFFQDDAGAIILIIDNALNTGDASGATYVSGSVWYKNFAQSMYTQGAERQCWFIYNGPYDCRSTTIISKSSLTPSDGYRKLGTFSGLSRANAFK